MIDQELVLMWQQARIQQPDTVVVEGVDDVGDGVDGVVERTYSSTGRVVAAHLRKPTHHFFVSNPKGNTVAIAAVHRCQR
jgi:hypothetical protein